MGSIVDKLSQKDRQILALFYETESYTALKKLFKLVKNNTASRTINAIDFHQVKWLQGQYTAVERLEEELDKIHKLDQKR